MNYFKWQTRFDEAGKIDPATKRLSLEQRLHKECWRLSSMKNETTAFRETVKVLHEYFWLRAGAPYYNVHPQLVSQLCRTNLGKIPVSLLEVPGGFHAVNMRFAQEHPDLSLQQGVRFVRNILFARGLCKFVKTAAFKDLISTGKCQNIVEDDVLHLYIDTNETEEVESVPVVRSWVISLPLQGNDTLDVVFERTLEGMEPGDFERIRPGIKLREVFRNCLRLVATVGFMANCSDDDLVEYDILSKDRAKFHGADEATKKKLIERARRRGKVGWNIGTNEMFVGQRSVTSSSSGNQGKWEHQFAHIRTGHPHAVRFGPGRSMVKIKWFRPTVVRPDLPFQG